MTVIVPLRVIRDRDYDSYVITVAVVIDLECVGLIVGKCGRLRSDDWDIGSIWWLT